MKITCDLMIFVLVCFNFVYFPAFGASTEDLQMKVKEPSSFRPSSSEMCNMLEKANLENRGFQKEVVRKSSQKPGRTGSDFETVYNYEKVVNCSVGAIQQMGVELNTSLPGAFGREMSRWVTKEVKGRHFDSNGKCALGLEVDFRGGKGCDVRSKSKNVKKRIRRLFGFNIKASIRLRLKGLVFRVPRVNYTSFL
ncbi:hypothetical protein pdam_00000145 [Pocillopora damicornis]|uniref:Secreted protein n=1 Tax=Pocillopora damicornis TaxID=46731 RepID=A0A3M6UXI0_POCDA|nr:uncharacterized protein LOC113683536 [Pocillopora damicornis]RMX58317.1 hypothetical protein pdam_00000145 [Pocillopora damicornis]